MKVELKRPQDFEAIQQAWKEIDAPCYIRATRDPKKFSIIPRKGVSAEMVNFFLIDQMSDGEDRKRLEKKVYKSFFNRQIKEIEKERNRWKEELKRIEDAQ